GEALGEPVDVLHVIVEDRHVERREPGEAGERVQRVEVVVEDRDAHEARGGRRRRDVSHAAKILSRADLARAPARENEKLLAFFGRDLRGLARGTWNGPARRDYERMRRLRGKR